MSELLRTCARFERELRYTREQLAMVLRKKPPYKCFFYDRKGPYPRLNSEAPAPTIFIFMRMRFLASSSTSSSDPAPPPPPPATGQPAWTVKRHTLLSPAKSSLPVPLTRTTRTRCMNPGVNKVCNTVYGVIHVAEAVGQLLPNSRTP